MRRARGPVQPSWSRWGSIRVRLTLWYVALLALVLLGFSTFVYLSLARNLAAEADRLLKAEADRIIALLDLEDGQPTLTEQGNTPLPERTIIVLTDHSGTRRFATPGQSRLPVLPEALAQAAQGQATYQTMRLADGADWRVLTLPILDHDRYVGILQVARSQYEQALVLRQLLTLLALAAPVMLGLAGAGGLFLAGRALGPVDYMTRAAQAIGADDLTRRLEVPPHRDEVGRLAVTFNQMLDRLEGAFQRQRQFTADASHELRTPLTMLASQVDVTLARARSAAQYRRVLTSMREDITRMNALVSELLLLARADAGQEVLGRERLALESLVDDVLLSMMPLAQTRGIRLERGEGRPVLLEGDQTRLTQLVINLVDNALKYTPAGGTVTATVDQDGPWAVLRVADTGVGIALEHLPHLFERFYRADQARARAEGGVGLGLAIAQWIAQAHGGTIEVTSQVGHGTTVTVRLPLVVLSHAPDHAVRLGIGGAEPAPPS